MVTLIRANILSHLSLSAPSFCELLFLAVAAAAVFEVCKVVSGMKWPGRIGGPGLRGDAAGSTLARAMPLMITKVPRRSSLAKMVLNLLQKELITILKTNG